ncbi:MAG: hypothetical protein GY928_22520 [Colwellia sp.]|nr:hypothetical protein [Colwellia sp.]
MSTELATEADNDPIEQFRKKIADRIRGDIGDLMPDEMLQKIVKETIKKELDRPVTKNHQNLSWIQKQISETIEANLQITVKKELQLQDKIVAKAVGEAVKNAIPEAMTMIILSMIKGQTYQIEQTVANIINNRY